jgi:hypothetical protein
MFIFAPELVMSLNYGITDLYNTVAFFDTRVVVNSEVTSKSQN